MSENKKRKINNQIDIIKINNDDNDKLFFRMWRNIVVRNEILNHIRLYNIHQRPIVVNEVDKLHIYKCNGYLKSIYIDCNIEFEINSLPYGLESILFSDCFNQPIVKGMIPDSVTSIEFFGLSEFDQTLDGNWLPISIKSLKFGKYFQQPIKVGHLPESLTRLQLNDNYNGFIEPGSISKSIKCKDHNDGDFGYFKFYSKGNKNLINNYSIPRFTTNLHFDMLFNQPLKKYDIPHNVTSLHSYGLEHVLEPFVLPPSITDLSMEFYKLEHFRENILPPNLTSLSIFGIYLTPNQKILPKSITTLKLYEITEDDEIDAVKLLPNLTTLEIGELHIHLGNLKNLFPRSLTSINIETYSQRLPPGFFINHLNLKTLAMNITSYSEIPANTLPPSITSLNFYFQKEKYYQDPMQTLSVLPSLANLTIGTYFNSNFDIAQLKSSSSLTSLTLGGTFNNPINDGILPNSLKELYLLYSSFDQYIPTEIDQLPTSLKSIIISPKNHKFINNLDINFISKYIKYYKLDEIEEEEYK